jgi:hypothetical protein
MPLEGWNQNVVYRLHPMGNKYLEQSSFKAEITQEMLQEQLYILHDVGASSFVVSSTLYSALKEAEKWS